MILLVLFCLPVVFTQEYDRLDSYNVDKASLSVSGLSSGGGFANSFYVANSASVVGAAIFAGMPYGCRNVIPFCENAIDMAEYAEDLASQGLIDAVENMNGKPLYVFHGTEDWMVSISSAEKIRDFYTYFQADVATNITSSCGHGVPTNNYGVVCENTWLPGLNKCSWSGGFAALQHIYKNLEEPDVDQPMSGQFMEFDQKEFTENEVNHSFDEAGYAYIPSACIDKTVECRVHVMFHGCFIVRWLLGDEYAKNSGFSEVGEVNNIIMLFPQLAPEVQDGNIGGCWDNFGYSGEDFDQKSGAQIRIIQKMVDRVAGDA